MRMHASSRSLAFLLIASFATLAGCECNTRKVAKAKGDPKFVETAQKDPHLSFSQDGKTLTVDFGFTLVNQDKPNSRTVTIKNDGVAAVTILKLDKEDGFNSDVFKVPNQNEVAKTIPSGGTASFTVSFAPTEAKDYTNKFTLESDVDDTTTGTLTVVLKGTGVSNGCILQPSDHLDFGNVKNGASYQKKLVVQNTTPLDWTFTFQGVTGTDKDEFSTDLAVGDVVVKSQDSLTITVTFIANHPGSSTANLQFTSSADMCGPVPFALQGNGVDSLITATPDPVDFGFVDPGIAWGSVASQVILTNIGNDSITLVPSDSGAICDKPWAGDDTTCDATAEFANSPDGTVNLDGLNLTLDPGASQQLTLYFKPARLHSAKGHMQFKLAQNSIQPNFGFDMVGVGGGPKIQVRPPAIDYGTVAIGAAQNRTVVITNVGSSPSGQASSYLNIPTDGLKITPGAGTANDEFSVDPAATAALPKGLQANQSWPVAIKFNPNGEGARSADLHISSNDPTQPDTVVHLQATGKQMPPCSYTVSPPSLNFGNVQPGRNRIISFRITNNNTTGDCLISNLDLGSDTTNPPFSLVDGPVASQTLAAGASADIGVKFAPTQSGNNYTGSITFFTSSTTAPQATVQLSGGSSPGCLLITPDDLDFGTVQVGCASRERTFTVYNVCNSSVSVTSIGLMPDATGRCPDVGSTHTCPFRITQAPSYPKNIPVGGSVDFKMKFQPGQPETDDASVAVQTANLTEPYVVTLHGVGATTAVQTDVFRQDAQPKVDVLLVVDDSCSMTDKQNALAQNFQSFIQFAVSQQVDYHIGVTTTTTSADVGLAECPPPLANGSGAGSLAPCGMLSPADGSRARVLTNSTPNLESVFGQNVALGSNGSATEMGFEGAYEALSAPNDTGWNAGFLRDEANLAVVAVSDASDQSPNSFDFYKNFFLNIKGFRRTNAFTFSAVSSTGSTPPSGSCTYDGTNVVPNPYGTMASATNGVFQEICTTDWASSLRQLGQSAFGYRTRFFLSETPDTSYPITVQLDGVDYPATTARGTLQWTYNPSAGAIDFQPLAVPEPGSTLTISYHVLCYPTTP